MAALRTLAGLLGSRTDLDRRRGGREVGYAMVRRAPEMVEALRGAVDDADRDVDAGTDSDFARGYRAALRDALAGFAAALDSRLEVERAAEALGRREVQVLRALGGEARPQVKIARELAMAPHDLSRAAKRLRAAGLIQAYPGERETEQLHRVTALGRAVIRELDVHAAAGELAIDAADFAAGTPSPLAESPLYAELDSWRPEPPIAEARPARAASPRGGDVRELDTASDRWHAHADAAAADATDEDE